jgi:hypothetical protein
MVLKDCNDNAWQVRLSQNDDSRTVLEERKWGEGKGPEAQQREWDDSLLTSS